MYNILMNKIKMNFIKKYNKIRIHANVGKQEYLTKEN